MFDKARRTWEDTPKGLPQVLANKKQFFALEIKLIIYGNHYFELVTLLLSKGVIEKST